MRCQNLKRFFFNKCSRNLLYFIFTGCFFITRAIFADDAGNSAPFDFAKPSLLTGTLYAVGSTNVLFTFRRVAMQSNSTVNVHREFFAPGGSVAAEEDVIYNSGQLVSYQMREFQADVSGTIKISPDPKNPGRQKLFISYGRGLTPPIKGSTENLLPDTVIDDNLFILFSRHWDDLMQGGSVKFQFVSLEHERTYSFRLVRIGESVQNGQPVEQIKMEATGFFVSKLVDPLIFTVEKNGEHRVLSYVGRTTPRINEDGKWKYLDAKTIFNW